MDHTGHRRMQKDRGCCLANTEIKVDMEARCLHSCRQTFYLKLFKNMMFPCSSHLFCMISKLKGFSLKLIERGCDLNAVLRIFVFSFLAHQNPPLL